jgi:hypothetical protein
MITTTLTKIRAHSPCESGWNKLLKSLGKTMADNEPLKFSAILASNGIDDTIWCLRSICPEHENDVRLFAADCAEAVLPIFEKKYPGDARPRLAIEADRKFANGEIDAFARDTAWVAAWVAVGAGARDAAWVAGDAAWLAPFDVAWATWAAWSAPFAAARNVPFAAGAAAWDAQGKMLTKRFS